MSETRFLLSGINNPNAPMRSNGVRWWGHPSRNHRPRVIVVHTAETAPTGSSARSVAEWQSRAAVPSSYHVMVDSRTTLRTVRDDHTAFHAASFNSISLGISWATRAALWGTYPDWDTAALHRAATVCQQWQALYNIPARWLSRPQVQAGASGFVRHSTLDPARRSDPGIKFPAREWFAMLADPATEPTTAEVDMAGVSSWAQASWRRIVQAGLLNGERPKDTVTREELAVVLDRLDAPFLVRQRDELAKLDPPTDGSALSWLVRDLRARR